MTTDETLSSFWRHRRSTDRPIALRDLQMELTYLARLILNDQAVQVAWHKDLIQNRPMQAGSFLDEDGNPTVEMDQPIPIKTLILDSAPVSDIPFGEPIPDSRVDALVGDTTFRAHLEALTRDKAYKSAKQEIAVAQGKTSPANYYDYSNAAIYRAMQLAKAELATQPDVDYERIMSVLMHKRAYYKSLDAPPAVRQYVSTSLEWKREKVAPVVEWLASQEPTFESVMDLWSLFLVYGTELPESLDEYPDVLRALMEAQTEALGLIRRDNVSDLEIMKSVSKIAKSFGILPKRVNPPPMASQPQDSDNDDDKDEDDIEDNLMSMQNPVASPESGDGSDQGEEGQNDDSEEGDGQASPDGTGKENEGEEPEGGPGDDEAGNTSSDEEGSDDDKTSESDDDLDIPSDESESGTEGQSSSDQQQDSGNASSGSGAGKSGGDKGEEKDSEDDGEEDNWDEDDDSWDSDDEDDSGEGNNEDDTGLGEQDPIERLKSRSLDRPILDAVDQIDELTDAEMEAIKSSIEFAREDITSEVESYQTVQQLGHGMTKIRPIIWEKAPYDAAKEAALRTDAYKSASGISQILQRFNRMRSRVERGQLDGYKLDRRRIGRVTYGNQRVWVKRSVIDKLDMTFVLLRDASGSIGDSQWDLIDQTGAAFAQALGNRDDVEYIDTSYTDDHYKTGNNMLVRHYDKRLGRLHATRPYEGNTPSAMALAAVRESIFKRLGVKHKDKIIVHLTDGDPNFGENVKQQVELNSKAGIATFCMYVSPYGYLDEDDKASIARRLEPVYGKNWQILAGYDKLLSALTKLFGDLVEVR